MFYCFYNVYLILIYGGVVTDHITLKCVLHLIIKVAIKSTNLVCVSDRNPSFLMVKCNILNFVSSNTFLLKELN